MSDQSILFVVLGLAFALFVLGRWRYDIVALAALLFLTAIDVIPVGDAFSGFGHPAVITVGAVLVASRGLQNSGVIDIIAGWMSRVGTRQSTQTLSLTGLVGALSSFINNVGALALLMPVAIRMARRGEYPRSLLLMPLAFGSLLGGMVTLIGTPPNIIIASFRRDAGAESFAMFDFAPVGLGIAVAGLLFVSLIGWRLIPKRKGQASPEELFQIEGYTTELRVPKGSKMVGKRLRELESAVEAETIVLALVRRKRTVPAPSPRETIRTGDVLIVEGDSEALEGLVDATGLELVGSKELEREALGSDEVSVMEVVVTPGSLMEGRTAQNLNLRGRFGVNLLAVARQGSRLRGRLANTRLRAGDVLVLQGQTETLQEALPTLGSLPLAERGLRLGQPRRLLLAIGIFGTAIVLAATGVLSAQVALASGAVGLVLFGHLSLREAYQSIDWSIIVLLGAMIPVGQALESTGGAELIADNLLDISGQMPAVAALTIVLVGTMFLSDVVNNAAAAVLMAPIAISVAHGVDASADPFLMAVAIGASAAFLTPIGHQSNTLVMGPGGYKFGDYWRMGLPLEMVIVAVAIPLLLLVWPL